MSTKGFAPPKAWKEILERIRSMRKARDAPVDFMGCHKCADPDAEDKIKRFQTLVSLILSSQTKDEITYAALSRLKKHGLTVESMIDINQDELAEIISSVGFYKKKAIYIKGVAKILREKYDDDLPKTVEELVKLPGVGPKMAYLTMNVAWQDIQGIGVDTHVDCISKRIGFAPDNSRNPEETRKSIESWLPKEYWGDINELFVGFGQQICTKVNPKCSSCMLNDLCPYYLSNKKL